MKWQVKASKQLFQEGLAFNVREDYHRIVPEKTILVVVTFNFRKDYHRMVLEKTMLVVVTGCGAAQLGAGKQYLVQFLLQVNSTWYSLVQVNSIWYKFVQGCLHRFIV